MSNTEQVHFPNWPEWHQQPLLLTVEEMASPETVVQAFFDCYSLSQARHCLHEWLVDAASKHWLAEINYLSLYEHTLKLVEAAWLMRKSQQLTIDNG
jgi:hypothetical protein